VRPPEASLADVVGHEIQSLSDVRGFDARSAQICRPDGVTRTFQVSRNNIQPGESILACNLFPKDRCRATLADEPKKVRPKVALVFRAALLTCVAERLTGTGAGPDGAIVGPSSQSEGVTPSADTGEEMALSEVCEVIRLYVLYASFVHYPLSDVAVLDEFPQPCGGLGVVFVVVVNQDLVSVGANRISMEYFTLNFICFS
jgi:hypothetical protein